MTVYVFVAMVQVSCTYADVLEEGAVEIQQQFTIRPAFDVSRDRPTPGLPPSPPRPACPHSIKLRWGAGRGAG